jgi:uncharacterized protein YqgC (DUF456 family)
VTHLLTVGLALLNLVFWAGILFGLPGTWLMVLCAALAEWWTAQEIFGVAFLATAAGLALLGELLEFASSAAGARQSGGSKRGAFLAITGGIVGGITGTLLPAPILGTLVGASAGAFAGSVLGDLWAGRRLDLSVRAGQGAALGRFWGTVSKLAIGLVLVVAIAIAPYV